MQQHPRVTDVVYSLRQVLTHGAITATAVLVAFSLPQAARYILYEWWPIVEKDANMLLATEIGVASVIVLLLNFARIVWYDRQTVGMARLASLAFARNERSGWLSRRREYSMLEQVAAARDVFVLTLTGFNTFVAGCHPLRNAIESAYEIRVLLVNPLGEGLLRHVESMLPAVTLLSCHKEIEASIAYLAKLRRAGKRVTLKFYEREPFWKIIVLGDHVWVQHLHRGRELKTQPEFVFALQHNNPGEGLYIPFYLLFLEQWGQSAHAEYDFDTNELVHRDASGREHKRSSLGVPINGAASLTNVTDMQLSPHAAAASGKTANNVGAAAGAGWRQTT